MPRTPSAIDRAEAEMPARAATEPAWTPGPWIIERHDEDDSSISYEIWNHSREHYTRIVTLNDSYYQGDPKALTNARLIVAAPTMADYIKTRADEGDARAVKLWKQIARGEQP